MAKLKSDIDYVQYALDIAYDDRYYYAHSSDKFAFSCSTLVGHSLFETGYVSKDPRPADGHAIGGSVLDSFFREAGFVRYTWANAGGLKPGDALIVQPYHVAWHVKDGIMVAANGNGNMVDRSPTAITTYDYRLVGTPQYVWRPTKIHKKTEDKAVTADKILDVMRSWLGLSRNAQTHRPIIDIYNSYRPLARGYAVTYWDDYCDATVSAAFIMLNAVSAIGGTECGVQEHIGIFKRAGIWKGRKKPSKGWIITYDWDGDGVADHIGIVEKISGTTVTAIEGNTSGGIVGRRTIEWNAGTVFGYAEPKYDQKENYMFTFKKIQYGSTGNNVRVAQILLRGYKIKGKNGKDLTIDGSFGDNVKFATEAFQKKKKLPVTGVWDEATWKKALKR